MDHSRSPVSPWAGAARSYVADPLSSTHVTVGRPTQSILILVILIGGVEEENRWIIDEPVYHTQI